jgi:hypothetical protein
VNFEERVRANEAARSCADALIVLRPDWAAYVRVETIDGLDWIDLSFPNDEAVGPLTVEFDGDEISIFISRYHCHLYFGSENGPEARTEASRIIEGLLADRLLVAIMADGEEWLGSGLIEKHAADQLGPVESADCELTIQSWSGRHDRKIPASRKNSKPLFDLGPVDMFDLGAAE